MSATQSTTPRIRTSSCLCGACKLELVGEPMSFFVCHCSNCRNASGTPFMANVFFRPKNVTVKEGKETVSIYKDMDTKSGNPLIRAFCGRCGSNLYVGLAAPYSTGVPYGTIKDSDDLAPTHENHGEDRRPWVQGIDLRKKSKL
ncbi:hypothetical protein AX15_003003 [Amanita polypyramis BW_CC]|nr:hypothetical protein AX15_003003 [Amanita polypyramis BW_CC]